MPARSSVKMSLGNDYTQHDLEQMLYIADSLKAIREKTGFGSIEFEVKDNEVSFRRYTVREHPQKRPRT